MTDDQPEVIIGSDGTPLTGERLAARLDIRRKLREARERFDPATREALKTQLGLHRRTAS